MVKSPSIALKIKRKIIDKIQDIERNISQKEIWSNTINKQEFRVVGMMRTGNHAIISWLRNQVKGKAFHLNNLIVDENPYRHKYYKLSDFYPQHKTRIENYRLQATGNLIPRDCLIYNYEDYDLSKVFSDRFEKTHDLYLGKTELRHDIIIIRDPFNLIASRLKSNMISVKDFRQNFVDLWIAYAKEYVGETNYLKHNKLCISYNQWCSNIDYRRSIADRLNLEFSDTGIDNIASHGGGSSFDKSNLNIKASEMETSKRWKHYADDPYYRKLVQNRELLFYAKQIFGNDLITEVNEYLSLAEKGRSPTIE
jgi:hypothetical protein